MTPTQAKRAILKPTHTRKNREHQAGWFYIEDDGLSVLAAGGDGKATCVKVTWKQIERAQRIKKLASSSTEVRP